MAAAFHRGLETGLTMWDAAVVGAGPAGSIAARQLARDGASVLLVDRQRFPRWKVCGACLGPGASRLLDAANLGALPSREGAVPLDRFSLAAEGWTASVALRGTVALSRAALDHALVDEAVTEGVEFRDGVRVDLGPATPGGVQLEVRTAGVSSREEARVVIDATGLSGGLEPPPIGSADRQEDREGSRAGNEPSRWTIAPGSRVGIGATLDASEHDLPFGELRMVVGRRGYVGLVRVEGGLLNVAAAIDRDALKEASPEEAVKGILAEAGSPGLSGVPVHSWKGTPSLTRHPRTVAHRRLFRLGDAAGYVEPFTGEGMSWAIASGMAVVPFARQAIREWTDDLVALWAAEHRRRIGRSQRLCRSLARGLRRPRLVRTAVRILARAPILADPFVRSLARAPAVAVPGHASGVRLRARA